MYSLKHLAILLFVLSTLVLIGIGSFYLGLKFNQEPLNNPSASSTRETDNSKEEIEGLKEEIEALKSQEPQIVKVVEKTASVPTPSPEVTVTEETQEEEIAETSGKDVEIVVDYLVSSLNEDGYGYYSILLSVTPISENILVPRSTNDSTQGVTGITYTIEGDTFSGGQYSDISCGLKNYPPSIEIEHCKFKLGKTSELIIKVWLNPYTSGNYSLDFGQIKYTPESEVPQYKTWDLAGEGRTDVVYIP